MSDRTLRPTTHEERQHEATYGEPQLRPGAINLMAVEIIRGERADRATLPTDAQARKDIPLTTGLLDYFPAALLDVAGLSKVGNDQHNPGQPMHWNRGKSGDEADALLRHLVDRGTVDTDGVRHSAKVAWRALAMLQKELEEAGLAPLSRGSR